MTALLPAARAAEITDVLTEAFYDYPVMQYVVGATPAYDQRLESLVGMFVMARALRNDGMFGIEQNAALCAVATTSIPDDSPNPSEFEALRDAVWQEFGSAARERYQRCVEAWRPLSPDVPQLHVNMIGVRRAHKRTGLAGRLLRHIHALAERTPGVAGVSLTTEDPNNVAFYQHMGYEIVGHARIAPNLETWGFFRRTAQLGLILLLLACGGEPPERESAPPADTFAAVQTPGKKACDLLAPALISDVIGRAIKDGVTTNDYMGVSQCRFDLGSDSPAVMISLHRLGDIQNYRRVPGAVPVAGLGSSAVWNAGTRQLAVQEGQAVLSVSFMFEPVERKWAETLGRTALTELADPL